MASGEDQVYATLLLSDSYLPGALVLAHSLRDAGTTKKLVVLVTLDTVSAESITELKTVYDHVLSVPRICNEKPANLYLMNRADLHSAFTKINLWKQTQFSKVVYIDADVVAYRAPDELFNIDAPFAAAPDIGWPDLFNSGVMVLTPNLGDFYAMLAMAERGISFDGADQGLLNMHFKNNHHRLSFAYNVTPSAHYQYIPAYRHFQSSINMVHFIGPNKPWFEGRNAKHDDSPFDDMVGRWWAVYDRHYRAQEQSSGQPKESPATYVQYFTKGEFHPKPNLRQASPSQSQSHRHQQDQGHQTHPGPQHLQGHRDHQGSQGHQGPKSHQGGQADQGYQGPQDHQGGRDQGHEGHEGHDSHDSHQGHHEHQGYQGHQEHQGHHDHQGHGDHQERHEERNQEAHSGGQATGHHHEHTPETGNAPTHDNPEKNIHHDQHTHHTHHTHDQAWTQTSHDKQPEHRQEATASSWDAQRQPPPADSAPEALNFPSTHYKMSQDAAPFVPPPRYPSPPKNMWYEVPAAPPAPPAEPPKAVFPWEGQQPKPTRTFASVVPDFINATQDIDLVGEGDAGGPVESGHHVEPDPEPEPDSTETGTEAGSSVATLTSQLTTTEASTVQADPWGTFQLSNAWDEVPEINRYVDGLQKHQRGKSLQGVSSPAITGPRYRRDPNKSIFKLTDFPSALERPSLPVTPAPKARPSFWGQDEPDARDSELAPPLPAAEGVPMQSDWDPEVQLQKLARQQYEALLLKLEASANVDTAVEDLGHNIPNRSLPFGSEGARSPGFISQSVPAGTPQKSVKSSAESSFQLTLPHDAPRGTSKEVSQKRGDLLESPRAKPSPRAPE